MLLVGTEHMYRQRAVKGGGSRGLLLAARGHMEHMQRQRTVEVGGSRELLFAACGHMEHMHRRLQWRGTGVGAFCLLLVGTWSICTGGVQWRGAGAGAHQTGPGSPSASPHRRESRPPRSAQTAQGVRECGGSASPRKAERTQHAHERLSQRLACTCAQTQQRCAAPQAEHVLCTKTSSTAFSAQQAQHTCSTITWVLAQ